MKLDACTVHTVDIGLVWKSIMLMCELQENHFWGEEEGENEEALMLTPPTD